MPGTGPAGGDAPGTLRPVGRRALLVACPDPPRTAAAIAAAATAAGLALTEVVPAAASVLVEVGDASALPDLRALLAATATTATGATAGAGSPPEVEITVRYDGEDLAAVAATLGLSPHDVVAAHSGARYRVAFCGFAPGFAYLEGLPPVLVLPRRPDPRPRVPAGSVAIADRYSAVYPRASPGGWHLLGRTDHPVWDPRRRPPAALAPGTPVRFVAG